MTDNQKAYHLALLAALQAQSISLVARLAAARKFSMSEAMYHEAVLCESQLDAVWAELARHLEVWNPLS